MPNESTPNEFMPKDRNAGSHLSDAKDALGESGRQGRLAGRAAIESIEEEWARLRSEIEGIASDGMLSKTPEVQALLERLRDRVNHASEMIGETSRHASRRIARVATDADDYVHEEPWKVATIAALAGVAIGMLITRR